MSNCNCKHGKHSTAICVECDLPQLARNNYFTGKLLMERDFTDEQHYHMGKERRHNQYLHGWGAVCGLKVKPHPNPACADQYVLIDPGAAIDCCGREILVRQQECFDFKQRLLSHWEEQHGTGAPLPREALQLQICVSYRECFTEQVPSLYDDCGGPASQPNRILETYDFDVRIKTSSEASSSGAELKLANPINFADAVRVISHDATKRIYILTSSATTAAVYELDLNHSLLMPPREFPASQGFDLAVSPAGDIVYAAIQPSAAGTPPQIVALKAADLSQTSTQNAGAAAETAMRLAIVPADGRLISIGKNSGVLLWPSGLAAAATLVAGIANPIAVAVGQFAYVLTQGSNQVQAIDLSTAALTITPFAVGTAPSALSALATSAGDRLAVLDAAAKKLHFVQLPSGPSAPKLIGPASGFQNPPVAVQLAAGARWAFVLEMEAAPASKLSVQAVDSRAVELNSGPILGSPLPAGAGAGDLSLNETGDTLYVPYAGTPAFPGQIAVITATQGACLDLLRQAVDGCPECEGGDCIVLATINDYAFGKPVTEGQIDNYSDRHILASTSTLTELIKCLLEQGTGGKNGAPGQPGGEGPAGPGIDKVTVKEVPCDQPATATLSGVSPNRTLELTLPGCCNKDLTSIQSVSWKGNGGVAAGDAQRVVIGIAFSGKVKANAFDPHSVQLFVAEAKALLLNWLQLDVKLRKGNFATLGDATSAFAASTAALVNGLQIELTERILAQIRELQRREVRVYVKGDLIDDANGLAVDGNHLPPWLPSRKTGDGIVGGTFESWFVIEG